MNKRSNRGCLLYGIGFFLGLPLLLGIVGALLFAGRERSAKRKLDERLSKIVAQGLPIDDDTLLVFANSLTSKENTKDWLAALSELTSESFSKSTKGVPIFDSDPEQELVVPAPGKAWAEEKTVRDFLANWSDLRFRISKLSMKQLEPGVKPVRFLTSFNSVNTLLPQTQNMRTAAQLLMLNGQVAIYDRNSTKTRLSIEALLGCSRTLAGEPILVSQLVQNAIDGMGIELLKSALEHDVLSESDLLALLPRMLEGIRISPSWKMAMHGERGMMLPVFKHPEMVLRSEGIRWLPGRSTDALRYLEFMDQLLAVPDDNFDDFKKGLDQVEQDLKSKLDGNLLQRFDSLVTTLMTPAVASMGNVYIRVAAQRRIAALCIGVRLYEKRNGKVPTTLDDLKSLELGELRLDPAVLTPPGDKPFGYRIDSNQVVLWGFDTNQASSTPAEPPPTEEGLANAAINKFWIWTLETKPQ